MRYAAKRDNAEPALVLLARELGLPMWLDPPLDWWTCIKTSTGLHYWCPVEIKNPKKEGHANEYTKKQKRFIKFKDQHGLPMLTWRCEDDVFKAARARIAA